MNFGAFATPERRVIFDINDFDETYPAPWEWDLKRLATSFVIASLANGHSRADAKEAARAVVQHYTAELRELAGKTVLDAWYSYLDYNELIELTEDATLRKRRKQVLRQAMERTATREFVKLGQVVDGQPRIREAPPLVYHPDDTEEAGFGEVIAQNFGLYRDSLPPDRRALFDRYELTDVAMKVVGVGSVGLVCAIGLFFASEGDVLFLQVKQVGTSVLQPTSGESMYASHGERVVAGQRLMQAASDIFLGHMVGVRGTALLRPPAARREGASDGRDLHTRQHARLRPQLRLGPRPRARPLGRPRHHLGLHRERQRLRGCRRPVLHGLRRAE